MMTTVASSFYQLCTGFKLARLYCFQVTHAKTLRLMLHSRVPGKVSILTSCVEDTKVRSSIIIYCRMATEVLLAVGLLESKI